MADNETHGFGEPGYEHIFPAGALVVARIADLERQNAALVAAMDHPMLRDVFGDIEDSGTSEADRLWAKLFPWFEVRTAALAGTSDPIADARRQALEEAAMICASERNGWLEQTEGEIRSGAYIALKSAEKAIRALIDKVQG